MERTHTQTTTHYEVQKKRRHDTLEWWRQRQKYVIKGNSVTMHTTPRGTRRGVMVSADADVPSLLIDSNIHEVPPGVTSTVHRHSWDAIMFVLEGAGWTEINGRRVEWSAWDTLHLPAWAWHRHGNDTATPARFITWGAQPLLELIGLAILEEGGDTPYKELPPPPQQAPAVRGGDPDSRRLQRLAHRWEEANSARVVSPFDHLNFRVTPRGARSAFLVDPSLGFRTTGLTAVMHQLAPGLHQSKHRHGGEAYLYCVRGHGHSDIDGQSYAWEAGDLIVVDHWAWHQHFNDDQENVSSLIRVHNYDTFYMAMWALLDPMNLFEEPEQLDAPDVGEVEWPEADSGRPGKNA